MLFHSRFPERHLWAFIEEEHPRRSVHPASRLTYAHLPLSRAIDELQTNGFSKRVAPSPAVQTFETVFEAELQGRSHTYMVAEGDRR